MTHFDFRPEPAHLAIPSHSGDLRMREPLLSDAPRMAEYLNDIEVAGNLARVPHPYHLANARNWLTTGVQKTDRSIFAIDHKELGFVGMVTFDHAKQAASVGYWLGRPYWNRGIMTSALIASLRWYFTVTQADHVLSGVFHFNMASLAIQQKLGFVETGRSFTHCLARGQDVEHIDTELTRDAFELTLDNYDEVTARNTKRAF